MANTDPQSARDHAQAIKDEHTLAHGDVYIPPGGRDAIDRANDAGYHVSVQTTTGQRSSTTIVSVTKDGQTAETVYTQEITPSPDDPHPQGTFRRDYPPTQQDDRPTDVPTVEPPPQGTGDDAPVDPQDPPSDLPSPDSPEPDAPEPEEEPPEQEQEKKEPEGSGDNSDPTEPCDWCVPASEGGWWSNIPVVGDIADGMQNGLHLLTHGIHEGDVWKLLDGAMQIYDAASDLLVMKRIMKKLAKEGLKAAMKEYFKEAIERLKAEHGPNWEEHAADEIVGWLEKQMGGEWNESKRNFFKRLIEEGLDLGSSKLDQPKKTDGGPLPDSPSDLPSDIPHVGIDAPQAPPPIPPVAGPTKPDDRPSDGDDNANTTGPSSDDDPTTTRPPDDEPPPNESPDDGPTDNDSPDDDGSQPPLTREDRAREKYADVDDRRLNRVSRRGDPDATYEKNRRDGTPQAKYENQIINQRGDSVEKAGEVIRKDGKDWTEIDVETSGEVIEAKSGANWADEIINGNDSQIKKQTEYAESVGKQHVIVYDPQHFPPGPDGSVHPDLQQVKDLYPQTQLEPRERK